MRVGKVVGAEKERDRLVILRKLKLAGNSDIGDEVLCLSVL